MRIVWVTAAAVGVLALGVLQAIETLGVRDAAAPGAWVLAVPRDRARAVGALAGAPVPLPVPLRLLLARTALAGGDQGAFGRAVQYLPLDAERAELEGLMLERRGDLGGAAKAYLSAGDVTELERRIDELMASNRALEAVDLARAAVARMKDERGDPAALADAFWKLGIAEQNTTYVYARDGSQREAAMQRALSDYLQALALGPLIERYLLSAGAEEQNLGRLEAAHGYYARAQANDPASPDPYASLGEIALLRGDRAGAEALLREARSLDPASAAAGRLAQKLASAK